MTNDCWSAAHSLAKPSLAYLLFAILLLVCNVYVEWHIGMDKSSGICCIHLINHNFEPIRAVNMNSPLYKSDVAWVEFSVYIQSTNLELTMLDILKTALIHWSGTKQTEKSLADSTLCSHASKCMRLPHLRLFGWRTEECFHNVSPGSRNMGKLNSSYLLACTCLASQAHVLLIIFKGNKTYWYRS